MILVADSGSSKTDWRGYHQGNIISFQTKGINPYFLNAQDIFKILSEVKELENLGDRVREIYFYGSGCSSPDKHEVVSNGLSLFFTSAFICVENDLIGSAYATCGDEEGLVCILGTGSNVSYYDGTATRDGNHGLGYLLGDEGSGTYFGRKMLSSYLYGQMPQELSLRFKEMYPIEKEEVITSVYQRPFPNTYLATFSRFMVNNQSHPFIHNILENGFQEFIDVNIKDFQDYQKLTCHFVGSISWYYQDILRETGTKNNIHIGRILQKPIEGLFQYILKREGLPVQ